MSRERIISALDIGSHTIKAGVLLVSPKQDLKVIGLGRSPARGIRRGQIIDLKEAAGAIKEALNTVSQSANVKVSKVTVGLSGTSLKLLNSEGAVAVSRADGEISYDDVLRVLESAKAVSLPQNREIVHAIPLGYKIDAEENIKEPVGMKGVRLEVKVILVLASTPVLKLVRKVVEEAGCEVEDWVYTPLATAQGVSAKRQRDLGSLVLDIGGETTSFSVWEESELKDALVLPIGSGHITNDVAIGFRIAPELAEKIKVEYGACLSSKVSRREQVVLANWGIDDLVMSRWELAKIIEARVIEIFSLVENELRKIGRASLLPAGVVLTGGGSKLEGMVDLAKKVFKLPCELGRPKGVRSELAECFDPLSAALVGLLLYEYDREQLHQKRLGLAEAALGTTAWSKIKDWFSELMP